MTEESVMWLDKLLAQLSDIAQQFVDKMPQGEPGQEPPTRAFARGQVAGYASARELIITALATQ